MADWLSALVIFIIVLGFLSLGLFISRLGVLEARAFIEPVVRSAMDVPAKSVVEVQNPFAVRLIQDRSSQTGGVSFLFSSTVPCYVTPYWGLSESSIENAVAKEQSSAQNVDSEIDDDDDDDDDGGDGNFDDEFSQIISVDKIISGSYESKGRMEYYNPGTEHVVDLEIPSQLLASSNPQARQTLPLVFVIERSRNLSQEEKKEVKSCDIVALITTLHCSGSSPNNKVFSVAAQYIQIADGNIFPLKKLYISDSQTETTSSDSSIDSSQASDTALSSPTCVICHSLPISRVILPCRHACVCGLCFSKLDARCPMCRQWIMSYFLTLEEPELTRNEHEISKELNSMSARDIVGGIFRAS